MAGTNGTENGLDNGKVISETSGAGTGKNTSTKKASDGGTGRGKGTGTGTDNNSGGTTEKEKSTGLALVNPQTEESSVPTPKKASKPRKRTTKKTAKKNDEAFNSEQITALIMTTSAILSTSERGKFFALTEIEAKQIAEPLAKLIANNDSLKSLGEHSDSIALVMACFMIFAPRVFMWLQYEKAHKKPKGLEVKTIKGVKPNERKTERNNNGNNSGTASNGTNDSENVLASMPSIV